ncbi:MAG: hypothetical protein HY721_01880 [Planctomycetes bacterium]|nr:hypothetical protein [Planctomycetota bacterium]
MSVFRAGARLGEGAPRRYKIKITARDGRVLYWHKRGQLHTLEEDVARVFVQSFKPELFEVMPDGSMVSPPRPGESAPIERVEREAV